MRFLLTRVRDDSSEYLGTFNNIPFHYAHEHSARIHVARVLAEYNHLPSGVWKLATWPESNYDVRFMRPVCVMVKHGHVVSVHRAEELDNALEQYALMQELQDAIVADSIDSEANRE